MRRFGLRADADPQTYALGLKEVWEVRCRAGTCALHCMGVLGERAECVCGRGPGLLTATASWPHRSEARRQGLCQASAAPTLAARRSMRRRSSPPSAQHPVAAQQGRLVSREARASAVAPSAGPPDALALTRAPGGRCARRRTRLATCGTRSGTRSTRPCTAAPSCTTCPRTASRSGARPRCARHVRPGPSIPVSADAGSDSPGVKAAASAAPVCVGRGGDPVEQVHRIASDALPNGEQQRDSARPA